MCRPDPIVFFVSQPNTVRVLISGYGNEVQVRKAFEIGVHAFIEKPFTLRVLLEQLTVHIEKRNGSKIRAHDSTETEATPATRETPGSSETVEFQSPSP